jgi:chromosome segregation ATPase
MNDFRKERLKHPREDEESSGYNQPRQRRVGLLLLILGLALLFLIVDKRYEARDRELNDQLAQFTKQLEANSQQIGLLVTDLETVQKRVGVTQNEIKQARAVSREIREAQQKDVQTLNSQLVTKADSKQVDAKFQEVDEQITGVQLEVQASRQELEKTWEELSALGLHVTEQGKLVARTLKPWKS